MSQPIFLTTPEKIIGQKVLGLTIARWIDSNGASAWFEAKEDAGERRLLYLYSDEHRRDADATRVHSFRTKADISITIDGQAIPAFAIVGDFRLMMSHSIRESLTALGTRPPEIHGFEVTRVLGHGYKGVTYEVRNKDVPGTKYALKLTLEEEYSDGSYLPEVGRMNDCANENRSYFPQVHAFKDLVHHVAGEDVALICFVEDYMPGQTLAQRIAEHPKSVDVAFLEVFLRQMLDAIGVLQHHGLMHDDLHSGNIMVYESMAGAHIGIVDFGSAKKLGVTKKIRDDIRNLASHIAHIVNLIERNCIARTQHEETVLSACQALLAVMGDDDPMRRPEDTKKLLGEFDRYFERGSLKQRLERPFDFGNAEEIMDNQLLQKLSSTSFPWRDKIESSANMLVIGPRGCGKTTVFRSLSFRCMADAKKMEDALRRSYIGLYISCNKEFRQRFSAIDRDVLLRREEDVRHYFNLLVLREFAGALIACHKSGLLPDGDVRQFLLFVSEKAHIKPNAPHPSDIALSDVEAAVTRAIDTVRIAIWEDRPSPNMTRQDFVANLATLAMEAITPFKGKTLYLFVDDYTERKVPREAQRALNHILFVPNGIYRSKISSEVFGVSPDQTFGSFLDQDRDYKEWNLGTLYYLNLPTADQKTFLADIVNNRLQICGYSGRVEDVIGDSSYPDGTLERALKTDADARSAAKKVLSREVTASLLETRVDQIVEKEGKKAYYHGWDTICNLCTGDISNILELLDRIYAECRVLKTSTMRIHPQEQDSVIQSYALQYISKIKGVPRYGEKLFEIVNAFGSMSARLLREHEVISRPGERWDPYKVIRIELDEGFVKDSDAILEDEITGEVAPPIGGTAALIWILLQRYCIFVDADGSRSRRNTLASKVVLRRIFCPAFRTTLVNSESYTLDKKTWQALCTDPKGTTERYANEACGRKNEDLPLFPSGGER